MGNLSRLWPGLEIINKYQPNADVAAAHDEIYVGDYDETWEKMTPEERATMESTGWSGKYESWHHFV